MKEQSEPQTPGRGADDSDTRSHDRETSTVLAGPAVPTTLAATTASDPRRSREVVVIGAGVSGCACAVTLASAGVRVLLVNSAMDRVGLPAYGPDLVSGTGEWSGIEDVIMSLPNPLRSIWLDAAQRPASGGAVMNIDRRRVSIETKRLLEGVPGLLFRQGFVVDLRVVSDGTSVRVQAETIFGEVFEADATVVAVGLSLAGQTSFGDNTVEGGRYGEPASNGLCEALTTLGACFREGVLDVGPRMLIRDLAWLEEDGGAPAARKIQLARVAGMDSGHTWPEGYPPAPHMDNDLRCAVMLGTPVVAEHEGGFATETWSPLVSPDGAATGELYVAPGTRLAAGGTYAEMDTDIAPDAHIVPNAHVAPDSCAAGDTSLGAHGTGYGSTPPVETRVPVRVVAQVVANADRSGRLSTTSGALPVWVVGRAVGAEDYLQSLASGVSAARNIVAVFGGGDERA